MHAALCVLAGCFLAASCSSDRSGGSDEQDAASLLERFRESESRRSAREAALAWPDCIDQLETPSALCGEWQEGDTAFRLLAVAPERGYVPVIASSPTGQESADRVVLHLSGGPDDAPLSFLDDQRLPVLSQFHERGFTIASIGYWGTSFRTLVEDNEIRLASADLIAVYRHFRQACACEPIIVAESLGAGVLFYTMRSEGVALPYIAISPVLNGLGTSVAHFEEILSEADRELGAKRSNLYVRDADGQPVFDRATLVNSFNHLSRFARDVDTSFFAAGPDSPCSRVVIGAADPMNQDPAAPVPPRLVRLANAGHDLYEDAPAEVRAEFADFVSCIDAADLASAATAPAPLTQRPGGG